VNLVWAPDNGLTEQMAILTAAKGAGVPNVVLGVPAYGPNAEGEVRFRLQRLAAAGLLEHVVALYPIDEPNTARAGNRTDAEILATNAMLRRVMPDFGLQASLAVIYAASGNHPGLASYDWVGLDDYGAGCAVLNAYDALQLAPGQRTILVPGGASPWRQDPACFESRAHGDPRVVAIVPFLWQTVADGATYTGIRENGMRALYCQAGAKIVGGAPC
jgi:hypothetical protein